LGEGHGSDQTGFGLNQASRFVQFNQGAAVFLADFLVTFDDIIVLAGVRLAGLTHDGDEISLQIIGKFYAAGDDSPFDGVLAGFLLGTIFEQREKVV
jgi:hypothetical protein